MGFKDAGKPPYLGHRERLRRRFRESGADALPDYELLEMILFRAARRDTKPLAKAILAHFGSFTEALNAPEERPSMGFEAKEQFRILFLDKRNQIIADEVQQKGTVDQPRSMYERW